MPCGNSSSPAPNAFTSLPEASNLRIGGRFEPSQANGVPGFISDGGANAPQRSATQTLLPSGSMSMPLVEPQLRPSGIVPQCSMLRYGLGAELVGALIWPRASLATSVKTTASAKAQSDRMRSGILILLGIAGFGPGVVVFVGL